MLDDFGRASTTQARGRFYTSLLLAVAVCGAGGVAMVHATASVQPRQQSDDDGPITLPPELRNRGQQPLPVGPTVPPIHSHTRDVTPHKLPQTRLAESSAELPEVEPEIGFEPHRDEIVVRVEPASVPLPAAPAPLVKPVPSPQNRYDRLTYPPRAMRNGVQGVVTVQFDVLEDGRVANARIVDGPSELHDVVLEAASRWHFTPATRGGKHVRYAGMVQRIVFRLEDA